MEYTDGYKDVARFYDLFDNKANIPFYSIIAEDHTIIADIGAGTGRISIPLALDVKQVTAVEPSKDMLEILKEKIEFHDLEDKINVLKGSADTFDLDTKADMIILSGVFDHFLDNEQRRAVLRNLYNNLVSNGVLVFDIHLGLMKEQAKSLVDDIMVGNQRFQRFISSKIKDNIRESELTYQVIEDGDIQEKTRVISLTGQISYIQLIDLVNEFKFKIIAQYSDYQFSRYETGDELLILHLRKN